MGFVSPSRESGGRTGMEREVSDRELRVRQRCRVEVETAMDRDPERDGNRESRIDGRDGAVRASCRAGQDEGRHPPRQVSLRFQPERFTGESFENVRLRFDNGEFSTLHLAGEGTGRLLEHGALGVARGHSSDRG